MKLRVRLLRLMLAMLLPMMIFGFAAAFIIVSREEAVFQRGAVERNLAVLTAVDTELAGYVTGLQLLANSSNLQTSDLHAFYDEAIRMLAIQPNWRSITFISPTGQRITSVPAVLGVALPPVVDTNTFASTLLLRQPGIAPLVFETGKYQFSLQVPVLQDEEIIGLLSAMIEPTAIAELLGLQRIPSDWVGVVADGTNTIIARTMNQEKFLGQSLAPSLSNALDQVNEGWIQGETLENIQVYVPFGRSDYSGWTVAIGIPTSEVDQIVTRVMSLLIMGIVAAVVITVLLAMRLTRRISGPITSLALVARDIRRGNPTTLPAATFEVDEIQEVGLALVEAGETARDREQTIRKADRAKDEFLAMLGHELRNPLGAMSSASQILQTTDAKGSVSGKATDIIARQIRNMTRLVDDLLEVSRVTSGKITLHRQPMNLADAVERIVRMEELSGHFSRHELSVNVEPAWVDADDTRIDQILINLLGNAVKFTPAGGKICVDVSRQDEFAVIKVGDTGIGFPPELGERLFDVFVQGERSLDRSVGGLGLGLTLVSRLTELQGGEVTASSEGPGRGAQFTVRLPMIEPHADTAVGPDERRPVGTESSVLLIEDNEDARTALQAALALRGYDVTTAADGLEGVSAARMIKPDIAIVDIGLPEMDGYAVARHVRATAHGARMQLIALTGYGEQESRNQAFEAGFDEFMTKPVSVDALTRLIEDRARRS